MRNIFRRPKKRFSWNAWPLGRLPLWKDQRGSIAVMTAVFLLFLTGILGFAIDAGSWAVAQRALQGAADGAAYSAESSYLTTGSTLTSAQEAINIVTQAEGITAAQGFVGGASTRNSTGVQNATTLVTVTVNQPPKAGPCAGVNTPPCNTEIEVIVTQPQPRFFSGLYQAANPAVAARAVAGQTQGKGPGCVLALNNTAAGAVAVGGNGTLNAINCDVAANSTSSKAISVTGSGSLTTPDCTVAGATLNATPGCFSVTTGQTTADPYAGVAFPAKPATCNALPATPQGGGTAASPICYDTVKINAGATVTFPAGVYYITGGFTINGGGTVNGTGVTFFIDKSAKVTINGNAIVNLTAPTTGPTSGIVFFGDPAGSNTNKLDGGAGMSINGAIYFRTQTVDYIGTANSASVCTQLIADTVSISGNSTFNTGCTNNGEKNINVVAPVARLIE
jgi:Flp pilus assembly protein TadG